MMHHTSPHSVRPLIIGLIALLRIKQWIKNGFVIAPLIFSAKFLEPSAIYNALFACWIFCITCSLTYIVNDIRDIEADRLHPKKSKTRPLAAGQVTLPWALGLCGGLLVLIIGSLVQRPQLILPIAAYLLLNAGYTFYFKRYPVIDIFTIALGFVIRVYAGTVALGVVISGWMLVTSLCLALYLAAIKRRQELMQIGIESREVLKSYSVALIERYASMSATCALIFYSLFVMSSRPEMLVTVPLVLFGVFRYWYVVEAKDLGESPTDALLTDGPLFLTVVIWMLVCMGTLWPQEIH